MVQRQNASSTSRRGRFDSFSAYQTAGHRRVSQWQRASPTSRMSAVRFRPRQPRAFRLAAKDSRPSTGERGFNSRKARQFRYGPVAQRREHPARTGKAVSSTLTRSTNSVTAAVAQRPRASRCQREGRGFESRLPLHRSARGGPRPHKAAGGGSIPPGATKSQTGAGRKPRITVLDRRASRDANLGQEYVRVAYFSCWPGRAAGRGLSGEASCFGTKVRVQAPPATQVTVAETALRRSHVRPALVARVAKMADAPRSERGC